MNSDASFEPILSTAAKFDLDTLAWTIDEGIDVEYAFYRKILERNPGLALDAGCGTGRLLIAFLKSGFQVEACDIAHEMVSLCRLKAAAAGFEPKVYHLPIQELPFTAHYSAIYLACGTFMCITDDRDVDLCVQKLFENLMPGGQLVLNIMPPSYLHLTEGPFPTPWEPYYDLKLPDGSGELIVTWRATSISRDQVVHEENRYQLISGGKVVRDEISPGQHRWYSRDQLIERLRRGGFAEVDVFVDYTDERSPNQPNQVMCVVATRGR